MPEKSFLLPSRRDTGFVWTGDALRCALAQVQIADLSPHSWSRGSICRAVRHPNSDSLRLEQMAGIGREASSWRQAPLRNNLRRATVDSSRYRLLGEGMAAPRTLRFLWWNLESFAHYDAARKNTGRWPDSQAAYEVKRDRLGRVIRQFFGEDPPEVLAFAEATNKAAVELRDTFFPGYEVLSLDLMAKPDFDVAILYQAAFPTFEEQPPLAISEMPRGTRPMAVLDHLSPGNRIRIYACHWTARFSQSSNRWREDLASGLNRAIYRLVNENQSREARHVLVLGDLNEEPWGEPLVGRMYASRERAPARRPAHYSDHDIQRVSQARGRAP
jgi:hypothetical protein